MVAQLKELKELKEAMKEAMKADSCSRFCKKELGSKL
jgi:hypothetical protein